MNLSLPGYQRTRIITADGEELILFSSEPMTKEEIAALQDCTKDEIVAAVVTEMKNPRMVKR